MNLAASRTLGVLLVLMVPPSSWTEHFDSGTSLYRQGRYEEAAQEFRKAAAADDGELAARARFNLGNTAYAQALAASANMADAGQAQDSSVNNSGGHDSRTRETILRLLEQAIASYRSTLRLTPSDDDARFNLELAVRWLHQLQQSEPPSTANPQPQKQPQEQPQEGQQPESPPEDPQPSAEGELSNEPQQQQEQELEQQEQQSGGQPQRSDKESPGSQPQESHQPSAQSDQEPETRDPAPPAIDGELKEANPTESADREENRSTALVPRDNTMSQEEARKLLQSIRDRDLLRRLQRQEAQRARRVPVERDW